MGESSMVSNRKRVGLFCAMSTPTFGEKCFFLLAKARTDNGGKLGREEWIRIVNQEFNSTKMRTRRTACTPPSPADVTAYAAEIGYPLDGEGWCDFYAQKGWLVGRVPMKDWKCAVRNWKRNRWTVGGAASTDAAVTASLGALQMQLRTTEEELQAILYPGGCAFKTIPTGEKLIRANFLAAQRVKIKARMESVG